MSITVPLSRVAQAMVDDTIWFACGFARAADFARERLGRSRRWMGDLAALHQAMEALPGLVEALTGADGRRPLGRVAALLIGRIASPRSVASWIELARRSTVRDLRAVIARARTAGADSPPDTGSAVPAGSSTSEDDSAVTPGVVDRSAADDPPDGSFVRVPIPRALRAAFDEALDLYRAVEGTEASVTSFIEALVAESSSGDLLRDTPHASPNDACTAPLAHGPSQALRELALARSTDGWRHLPPAPAISPALAMAEESVASLADLSRRAGTGGPAELLHQMRALISLENEIEIRLGRLLAAMADDGAWSRLRFAGIGHYAEERLGISRTAAEDRARATRALRRFPLLRESYESDRLGLEAVLTVTRILNQVRVIDDPREGASPEEAWAARAGETTIKRLRDEARLLLRRAAGGAAAWSLDRDGSPGDQTQPGADDEVARRLVYPCNDDEWHASLHRAPGTARRRIRFFGMLATGRGELSAPEASSPATALIPAPDVFLRLRLPADLAADFLAAIEAARRRLSVEADAVPWDAPWPGDATDASGTADHLPEGRNGALPIGPDDETGAFPSPSRFAARTFSIRCRRVPAWVGLLALLEEFVQTWDTDARGATPANDRIYVRDGWRCTAPACSSRNNLEKHHVVYRSRGGGHGGSNRTSLCRFHHQRGEHGGLASCSGVAPLGLVWRLGRGDLAQWYRNERRLGSGGIPAGPHLPGSGAIPAGPHVPGQLRSRNDE